MYSELFSEESIILSKKFNLMNSSPPYWLIIFWILELFII
jgi:hypothetical protein